MVLKELFIEKGKRLHLREIERRTGLNARGIQRVLAQFIKVGIVQMEPDGNRIYFSVNEKCPIYSELRLLILKTVGLAGVIKDALDIAWGMKLAYIYGSFAEGQADSDSDVDLMIVGDVHRGGVATHIAAAQRIINREINCNIFTEQEYIDRLTERDGFVARVHNGSKIILYGEPDELG